MSTCSQIAHKAFKIFVFGAFLFAGTAFAAPECERNSDCMKGLVCGGTGKCIAECAEDVDCPAQGIAHKCVNTINRAIAPELGGGANAFQCVPRGEIEPVKALPKIHPEISNRENNGEDFWSFANIPADPQICARECAKQSETCRAWTMIKPDVQGIFARCWLKKTAGELIENGDAISGFAR